MEASAHRAQVLTIGRSGMEQSTRSGCADAFASCLHHGAPAYRREPAESVCRNAARLAGEGQVETRRDRLRCAHRTWKRAHNASAAAARSLEEVRRSQGLAGARASHGVRWRWHPGSNTVHPLGSYRPSNATWAVEIACIAGGSSSSGAAAGGHGELLLPSPATVSADCVGAPRRPAGGSVSVSVAVAIAGGRAET